MSQGEPKMELPAGAPKPGELFAGKYRVERILGMGGMGYVIAAVHVQLDERVAIKLLLPELAHQGETVARFLREGRAAVKIRSEHVGKVLDVGALESGTPFIVMEYLDGCDLSQLLEKQGRLPTTLAVDYVLQACEAIAEAHAMKTVHRDLKPANLFVIRRAGVDCIKVLDFGISKMNATETGGMAMTKTAAMMGSPLYMSPEQLKSSRDVTERADIWAIGVILYELIAGTPPFNAQNLAELGALVLGGSAPWLRNAAPECPAGLAEVVATCLRRNADDRFTSLADFADAIAPFGSPAARESCARIVATLGMPVARARLGTSVPDVNVNNTGPGAVLPTDALSSGSFPAISARARTAGPWGSQSGGTPETPRKRANPAIVAIAILGIVGLGVGGTLAGKHYMASRAAASAASASATNVVADTATTAASIAPAQPSAAIVASVTSPPAASSIAAVSARPASTTAPTTHSHHSKATASASAAASVAPSSTTQPNGFTGNRFE